MQSPMQRLTGDDGATMVEYALMVALIAVVCIAAVSLVGTNSNAKFSQAGNSINSAS
jgi:pilus assembly protein Flp/PilA